MGHRIYLNNAWHYRPHCTVDNLASVAPIAVDVPHTNIEVPYNHFPERIYQFTSCYQRTITPQPDWANRRILLTFEGVAHIAHVYLDGALLQVHRGGYTAFTVDLTDHLTQGTDHQLTVEVDSHPDPQLPPFGHVIDYMTFGGIYREVYLELFAPSHIEDIFVQTSDQKTDNLTLDIALHSPSEGAHLQFSLQSPAGDWTDLTTEPAQGGRSVYTLTATDIALWTLHSPALYRLKATLLDGGEMVDERMVRFGFRSCRFEVDGFYLNGERIKILGLNRHQSYPYVGYAMPKRPQQLDADILKYELGVNAVRTAHYPQSQHFIDRCDEIGLLVFTELTGWQHIGDAAWQDQAVKTAGEMVAQYRNHPSIILWGARINESPDNDPFYTRTNQIIHDLDPTRQTGGVRCIKKSHLLEDVYTYNDFSHNGKNQGLEPKKAVTKDSQKPYLVSECVGHTFPAKSIDNESHRLDHALRHASVIESLFTHADITGCFGWCMFDYHTHKDFGSGDRICHHGVMNPFRIPKLAAHVYRSQGDVAPVLAISSAMNIGEYPGGNIGQVVAFTNMEQIDLYKNGEFVRSFHPDRKKYPNMPHPPIVIDDFIGELLEKNEGMSASNARDIKDVLVALVQYGQFNLPLRYQLKMAKVMVLEKLTMEEGVRLYYDYVGNWGGGVTTYRFDGIRDDKVAISVTKTTTDTPVLSVKADTTTLHLGDSYDVATLRISLVDDSGEPLPYYQDVVSFEASGDIALVGPTAVPAIGGSCGTYVKTIGKSGTGALTIRSQRCAPVTIPFTILCARRNP